MEGWLGSYARTLEERLGEDGPGLALERESINPILELARIVAHGTERKNAPLATYVAGRYVSARIAQGEAETSAVAEAVEAARTTLPPGA
jgi:hypothetical protein